MIIHKLGEGPSMGWQKGDILVSSSGVFVVMSEGHNLGDVAMLG